MNEYPIGTAVRCEAKFYSDAARTTLADPTSVIFRRRAPKGEVTLHTYGVDGALVKDSTGIYYENVTPDMSGEYEYTFKGTGAVAIIIPPNTFKAYPTVFDD